MCIQGMDFLDDQCDSGNQHHGWQGHTQHFHHKNLQSKDWYKYDWDDHIIYQEGSLHYTGRLADS